MSIFQSAASLKKRKVSPFMSVRKNYQKEVCHSLMIMEEVKKIKKCKNGAEEEVEMILLKCPRLHTVRRGRLQLRNRRVIQIHSTILLPAMAVKKVFLLHGKKPRR
jgi:hypothetical protein